MGDEMAFRNECCAKAYNEGYGAGAGVAQFMQESNKAIHAKLNHVETHVAQLASTTRAAAWRAYAAAALASGCMGGQACNIADELLAAEERRFAQPRGPASDEG